jgi:pyruvate/2-oxoglutarate dehydrogenase complex dihydrolipoamide dehydrogenase (E3) component
MPTDGQVQIVTAWEVLEGKATPGARVVVADWRCDWIGPGLAERLTRAGSHVTLAVNGTHPGESLPLYVRDTMAATLQQLGVDIKPYARLYGTAGDTVYLQHTASGTAIEIEGIDTVVLALGHQSVDDLSASLTARGVEVHMIGDCLSPRTAEEAVYDGLKAGVAV